MKSFLRTAHRVPRRATTRNNAVVSARARHITLPSAPLVRAGERRRNSALPPETWYEPIENKPYGYRVVVRPAGAGFQHVLQPHEVRERLAEFPETLLRPLQVVHFSQMTRKKGTFPCYGMQWGQAIYLYPIEATLVETFRHPPRPVQEREARYYGGKWSEADGVWRLTWTEPALRDFYLNNILIHELGHLVDTRNTSVTDRERYAEWFAIEYGQRRRGPRS